MSGSVSNVMAEGGVNPATQKVELTGTETPCTLHGFAIDIYPSPASSLNSGAAGSSKVKITTVTNQNWDLPKGRGTIVASNHQFLAYVLEGKSGYVLRLIQPETSNRALLKGFVGAVVDVAFAHRDSSLLACVDEGGNMYLWDLSRVEDITKASTDALCVVLQRGYEHDGHAHRLVWSPHMDGEEDETLVISHNTDVEVVDVWAVIRAVPSGMKIASSKLEKGITFLTNVHSQSVCDMSLSPDGAVLATSGEDGLIKFWNVENHSFLHELNPHNGLPVTKLIFCDDHLSQDPSNQFWRFLLTVSGSELRLWCSVSWQCLQTLRFCSPSGDPAPHILLNLDLSASYLIVTDAMRAAVYVLQLCADGDSGSASLTSITEYQLKQPIYSFIVPGNHTHLSPNKMGGASSDSDDETGPHDQRLRTVGIKLHTIHSKSMQELEIKFDPPDLVGMAPPTHTSSLMVGVASHEHTPSPLMGQPSSLPSLFESTHSELSRSFHSLTDTTGSPKLLTPSEFTTPNKSDLFLTTPLKDMPTQPFEATPPATMHEQVSLTSVTMETDTVGELATGEAEVNLDYCEDGGKDQENTVSEELNKPDDEGVTDNINPTTPERQHPLESVHSPQEEALSSSSPSEFVSLPKSTVEVINDGTIVTASAMTTPVENLASFIRAESAASPEGNSLPHEQLPIQEKGAWPDIEAPDLLTTRLPSNQEVLGSGAGVIKELPVDNESINNVEPPPADSVDPIDTSAVEDAPLISVEPPPVPVNNKPPMEREAPVITNQSLLIEKSPETDLTMPSGNVEMTVEAFSTSAVDESHDTVGDSHDQPHDIAVASNEQPPLLEVKKWRSSEKRQAEALVNSQPNEELPGGLSGAENAVDLLALIARQQEEVVRLREEQGKLIGQFERRIEQLQSTLLETQAKAFKDLSKEQDARLDRVVRERQSSDKARSDRLASSLSAALKGKLDQFVKSEMKNMVLPALQRSMTTLQNDLSANVAQRADSAVREGMSQILQISGLAEAIGGAVASSLQRVVAARYEEVFKVTVLPGFEKACQEMFRQIDDAFRRGTAEYVGQLSQQNRQLTEATLQQVTRSIGLLTVPGSTFTTHLQSCVRQEVGSLLQHVQQVIAESVASCIAKEIPAAFEHQYKQSPEVKREEEKKQKVEELHKLVEEGKFNSAFEQALSTSDLKLVMYLCGKVNPDLVFDKNPCPLTQPVLLSLIQQLSVELHDQLDLKIKYLEHSLLALDTSNDVTKSHMTPVVSQLSQQLSSLEHSFQATPTNTTPALSKQVKRLKMMAQHLTH